MKLKHKALLAAEKFLIYKNYDILSEDYHSSKGHIDIVAEKDNEIVFIEVHVSDDKDECPEKMHINGEELAKRETAAIGYLTNCKFTDKKIRFDDIYIIAIDEDRAFLRHDIDVAGMK